mmetsp:Transcript_120740/g.385509  ORF Transcript_120740/g.385509 Transcript_120740/m.385509 type:complete len:85 (-) Transcript_120740:109-363(-)
MSASVLVFLCGQCVHTYTQTVMHMYPFRLVLVCLLIPATSDFVACAAFVGDVARSDYIFMRMCALVSAHCALRICAFAVACSME